MTVHVSASVLSSSSLSSASFRGMCFYERPLMVFFDYLLRYTSSHRKIKWATWTRSFSNTVLQDFLGIIHDILKAMSEIIVDKYFCTFIISIIILFFSLMMQDHTHTHTHLLLLLLFNYFLFSVLNWKGLHSWLPCFFATPPWNSFSGLQFIWYSVFFQHYIL